MTCPEPEALLAFAIGELDAGSIDALDAHLDRCATCRETVASLVSRGDDVAHGGDALAPGTRVARFVIGEPLGRGAMGVVYAAHDPELDRRVAVKLLREGMRDAAQGAQRLGREAQAMARLSHPHVVAVYDAGEHDGRRFVAMELIEGTSLRGMCARERGIARIVDVLAQAGRGLAAAHAAGIVHRDFKPENVLIDRTGTAKVSDFGLARAERDTSERALDADVSGPALTRTGALLGTPAYMAPEQLRGQDVDARADQFAFCVALFEAVEERRPFAGATVRELLASIEAGPPAMSRAVPRPVRGVVARGLRARREERFPTMDALLAALVPRARSPWRVALPLAVVAGVVAFAAARSEPPIDPCASSGDALGWDASARAAIERALAPGGSDVATRAADALDRWARGWSDTRVETCRATHVRHEQSGALLDRRMRCLDDERAAFDAVRARLETPDVAAIAFALDAVASLPPTAACDARAIAAREVRAPRDLDEARRVRRVIESARVRVITAQYARAEGDARDAVDRARALDHAPSIADAQLVLSDALLGRGMLARADEAGRAGLLAAESAGDDALIARAWLLLVRVAGETGRTDVATERVQHADAVLARLGRPDELEATLRNASGVVLTERGELEDAERELRAALALRVRRLGEEHPEVARVRSNLGNVARLAGRLDDALAEHRRALAIDERALSPSHPIVGRHHHNLGGVLRLTGDLDAALAAYEQALAIKEAGLGDHPEVALTENSLGLVRVERGELDAARGHYTRALRIFEREGHGDRAIVLHNLALLDREIGALDAALERVRAARGIDAERVGPLSKRVAGEWLLEGDVLGDLGRRDEAREAYAQAAMIARERGLDDVLAMVDARIARTTERPRARRVAGPPDIATRVAPRPEPPPRPPLAGSTVYRAGQAWD
ncbi:serine/threonine-protein kinase [Sandaracinus amylolyticus]|uniref:Serine/threonine protein kinase n=1 Tax=Sandaracinus amylolyticus TaxID=927083 RepID=A0A0F6W083_9BACT|nr:serine/threonine-protein kinase [Sandaracinus amylolyticus]AKF04123.1 Serine/threonine protein kinase [Sandaracinus amylolyticus]